jgi:D-alanyl-D-alanine carboxypeptidase (penicillin-binding protein 5/6)
MRNQPKTKIIFIISSILLLVLLFNSMPAAVAATASASAPGAALKIASLSAILLEPASGEVLFRQNENQQLPPASVTKLMVMLLAMEAVDERRIKLTDVVSASPEACKMGGSQIWLEPGEQMTVAELLKAVCIVSANDASYALSEHIAGSEESFVALMNKRAKELGLKQTSYVNTSGLEPAPGEVGNMTSASDMALLAQEVIKHPLVFQWTGVWIDSLRGGKSFLRNTNNLVRFYRGCDGLKTGFTNQAGFCLVATAKREGVRLIAVSMKAPASEVRSADISKLFNYGFSQFKSHQIFLGGEKLGAVKVFRGQQDTVPAIVPKELTAVLKRDYTGTIAKKIALLPYVSAPVNPGQKIGKVTLSAQGKVCGECDLVAGKAVKRASFFQIWRQICRKIIGNNIN